MFSFFAIRENHGANVLSCLHDDICSCGSPEDLKLLSTIAARIRSMGFVSWFTMRRSMPARIIHEASSEEEPQKTAHNQTELWLCKNHAVLSLHILNNKFG